MAILKRALIVLVVLLMIPVVLVAGLFLFARTETGLATIANLAQTYGSSADSKIAIGKIEGSFPDDLTVRDLALADRDGVWLTIDRVRLAWAPLALFSRKVQVEALELGRVDVARAPNLPASTEPEPVSDPDAPLIPDLPVEIELKRLAVDDLNLAEALMGVPARLAAEMSASLRDPREGVDARFDVRRIDGVAGRINGSASFAPQTERFQISIRGGEPAGGLIARLADMPGQPPMDIGIEGGGTLDALRVQAALTAGDRGRLDAVVELAGEGDGRRVKLSLDGDVGRIAPPAYAALVDGPTTANIDAFVPDQGPIRIADAVFDLPAARLAAKGAVDLTAKTLDVTYDLKAGDASRFAALLPPGIAWGALSAVGSANGPFTHPHVVATVDGTGLNATQGGAATAHITLDAKPNGPLTDEATRIAAKATVDAKSVTFADDRLLAGAGRDLTAAFDLVATVAGAADIAKADVALGDIKASYVGAVSGQMAKGKATLAAADLSPLSALAGRTLAGSANLAADVDVAFDLSRLAVAANGGGKGLKVGVEQVDALTGGDLAITGGVTRAENGSFAFNGLKVTGKHVALSADGSATLQDADVTFRAEVEDLNLVDPRAAGRATLDGKLTGRLDDLAVTAKLAVPDGRAMDRVIKDLTVDVDATDVTDAVGGVVRLGGSLDGKPVRGQARLVTEADGARRLEDVDLVVATASVKGGVSVTPAGLAIGRVTIAAPDLAEVGALALTELGGGLSADIGLSVENGVQKAVVTANGADIAAPGARVGKIDVAATVLDPTGKITVDGVINGSGIAAGGQVIERLAVKANGAPDGMDVTADVTALGAAASAAGRVVYAPAETRIDLSKLNLKGGGQDASLAGPAKVRLVGSDVFIDAFALKAGQGGALDLSGKAGQTLDLSVAIRDLPLALANAFAPDLGVRGALGATAKVTGPATAPVADFDVTMRDLSVAQTRAADVGALTVATKGRYAGDRVTTDTTVTGPGGLRLTAVGSAPIADGDLDMDVAIRALPLKLANGFVEGFGLAGQLNGDAKVTGPVAAPRGTYAAKIDGFTSSRAKGVPAVVIETKGELQGVRVTTDTVITGGGGVRATAKGFASIGAGPLDMDIAIAELPLSLANAFMPELGLAGRLQGGAKVTGPVSAPRGGYDFKITGLTAAQAKGVPALQMATKGELEGNRVTTNTEVTGGGGLRLTARGAAPVGAGDLDMTVELRSVPLALANGFSPGLGAQGTLQGDAKVSGPIAAPRGTYTLKVSNLSTAQTRGAGVPAAQIDSKGRLEGVRVVTDTVVTGAGGLRVTANGSAPLGQGNLDLRVVGRAPLAFLNDTLSVSGDRVDGAASFDVKVGGSTSAPAIDGTARLENASYSNRASGLQLRGIQAVVAGNGTNVEVRSLRATTRNGGTISGSGRVAVDPGRGFPGEIRIQAQNAEVVGTDIVTAVIDSNLTLQGALARRPVVSGNIRARSVEIQIPDRLPAQYTPLEGVKHRGAPARVTSQLKAVNVGQKTARSEDGFLATLDIDVQANDRIFIRGMGITSEAGGSIKLAGTSANPQPVGAFELRSGRGQIVVIGQRLTFTRGSVSFAGDLDPTLDFLAETKARDITAQVVVTGTASRPQIAFTSQPALPTDEVLARLLFKKSAGELNASEALQLAQGLAQYTGGGGSGALDSVRKSLGVDVLDVTAGDGQGGGPAVGVGRYISDNIYLGVRQGTSPDSSRVTVDIDVTKNVKVQGETGASGDASAGVAVEWDY
ncbi:translocation and assembly module TamB [Methylopila capsulata]|uniref:Translocation and assembly module TamB n=1 Tax=Methylopila capsulata TaxID=61654 RepID=A0A9W6ITN6_9HYPH|nr:translocation/assembly module TamB domain-containing protein [Methylopila capsulata]MBM7850093.1 translocation and assembly module TamB [Methylopila capsulata]GLK55384.1 translocation/assembly module TamB [Methylopila capsulata]